MLLELDPTSAESYRTEIKDILRRLMIQKRIREIEQSKVFVDIEGIKAKLNRTMKETFNRYVSFLKSNVDLSSHSELKDALQLASLGALDKLIKKVRQIIAAKRSGEEETIEHASLLSIVCALDSPELSSVRRLPWNWSQTHLTSDDTIYYQGRLDKGGTQLIHAAAAARMGMPAAAILASKMIAQFRPEYLCIVGITAGLPGKTKQGDILVANPCWDGGSGKWLIKDGALSFVPAPHQLSLSPDLRNKLRQMSSNTALLSSIRADWPADKPDHELSMLVGPMASGAAVLADNESTERIRLQHKDLLGVEMETYGVFVAAEEATSPRPKAFSIKSVSDFASPEKDDRFQKYAAYTSSQALRFFVENYLLS